MKKIGLCALALAGVLAFTGCSVLGEEKVDKIITAVEDKEVKLTQEQLDELLAKMEDKEITIDEAYNQYMLALIKLNMNYEGIRDNLVITAKNNSEVAIKESYYKDENGKYVYQLVEENLKNVVYEDGENVFGFTSQTENSVTTTRKFESGYPSLEAMIHQDFVLYDAIEMDKESILKAEYLENGNIVITCGTYKDGGDYDYTLSSYEISKDAKLISIKINDGSVSGTPADWEASLFEFIFEYGVANDADFKALLSEAKAAALTE